MTQPRSTHNTAAPGRPLFRLPGTGAAMPVDDYLAIRWCRDTGPDARILLLHEYRLRLARLDSPARNSFLRVNQSDWMIWVAPIDGAPVTPAMVADIGGSDAVKWVSTCYRCVRRAAVQGNLFTVNPARLYLRRVAIEMVGGTTRLDPSLTIEVSRWAALRGLVALNVSGCDAVEKSAHINRRLAAAGSRDEVRFETIQLLAPWMSSAVAENRSPVSDLNRPERVSTSSHNKNTRNPSGIFPRVR